MRILLSGSSGLIGSAFRKQRLALGDEVVPLVRTPCAEPSIPWHPGRELDPSLVSGFDVAVHLAGEPVAARRWTPAQKDLILRSRVQGTQTLASALAAAPSPPAIFLCASGINIYADHGDTILGESTPPGASFLPQVCVAWEAACEPLVSTSTCVANLRIGVVLSHKGGTLGKLLPIFRMGLGGPVGDGRAYMSWITLDDLLRAFAFLIERKDLGGPFNCVAPNPVTGTVFAHDLGHALHRPAVMALPAFAARLAFGELVDETMLSSVRAVPSRLLASGFSFTHPSLPEALASLKLR